MYTNPAVLIDGCKIEVKKRKLQDINLEMEMKPKTLRKLDLDNQRVQEVSDIFKAHCNTKSLLFFSLPSAKLTSEDCITKKLYNFVVFMNVQYTIHVYLLKL